MSKYDDDQCKRLKDDIRVKDYIIQELKRELTDCRDQLNSALRYGFEKNQATMVLHRKIAELYGKESRRLKGGKNR